MTGLALNQSCFPGLPTARFLEIAHEAGADAVELRVVESRERLVAVTAAVRGACLPVAAVNALMDWALPDDPDPQERLEPLIELAAAVGAPVLVCVAPIGRFTALPSELEVAASAAERLSRLLPFAAEGGVRLALEPVGRSSSRPDATGGIRSLGVALAAVEAAGDTIGLVLDAYNLATAGVPLDDVADLPPGRIALAQIADRDLQTGGRALPGEGDLALSRFASALAAAGYGGPLSLELFPSSAPADPLGFARRALEALRSLTVVAAR